VNWLEGKNEAVANVRATWTIHPKLTVTGYVRNIADNRYKNSATIISDPATTAPSGGLADPRTFGVIVNAGF
jgi:outer membrane receptor protein involved in Fe transport